MENSGRKKINPCVHVALKENAAYKSFERSPRPCTRHTSYFFAYTDLLEKYRGKKITFVEIGVLNGGSLFMWRELLGNDARIIGIDLNSNALNFKDNGFEIVIGNQASPTFWRNFFEKTGPVDVVLDDGGHTYEQQIITAHECIPHINDGGMIIIEDTHTSYFSEYGYPSRYSFIEWSKTTIDRINARHPEAASSKRKPHPIIYSAQFFESIVCLNIDRRRCLISKPISNGKEGTTTLDFRHSDSIVLRAQQASSLLSRKFEFVKKFPRVHKILEKVNLKLLNLIARISARRRNSRLRIYFK